MNRLLIAFLCLTLAVPAVRADRSLAEARVARQLVGPERWAQVIRIENPRRLSDHPASFHALVFELENRLWLYVPGQGTQSLSLVAGRTEQDKANLTPLLRAADPAFESYARPDDEILGASTHTEGLPPLSEGCFIHSLAAWRALLARGHVPENAGILVYYGGTARRGHAVLYYSQSGNHYVLDEARSSQPIALPLPPRPDPRSVALALLESPRSTSLLRAKLLPLHPSPREGQAGYPRSSQT